MIWAFAALLVVWGNVVNYFVQPSLPGGDWAAVAWGAALVAASLAFARILGVRRTELGLALGEGRGVLNGAALGVLAAGVGTAVLRIGPLLGPVTYTPLFTTTGAQLAAHIAFFLPLAAAIPEEIAFRGALLAGLQRAHGLRIAIVGSSVAFALWHAFVVWVTVFQTSLANTALAWLAGLAALAFLAIAAAVLALLRLRSRTIVAPILAHWTFDATLLVGLWA